MKKALSLLFGFLICFTCIFGQNKKRKHNIKIRTYNTFADQKTTYGYHKAGTITYKIKRIPIAAIQYGDPKSNVTVAEIAKSPYYSTATKCSGDVFAGIDRAVAKTHEAVGTSQSFTDFDKFYNSRLLVPDAQMINHNPTITKNSESPRVKEELINVTINTAYIYGIYREDDDDFHMIIGNGNTGASMKLFNVEISGLPDNGDNSLLVTVRNKVITRFGDINCRAGAYKPVGTLIPIRVTGSLFFDIDHSKGKVGFGIYKPTTAWELHPITDIHFLDE